MDYDLQESINQFLDTLFKTETQLIRAIRTFLMYIPKDTSSSFSFIPDILNERMFNRTFDQMFKVAFSQGQRPGSLISPRVKNKEQSWDKFFKLIIKDEIQFITQASNGMADQHYYNDGDDVLMFNNIVSNFKPNKLKDFHDRIIQTQLDWMCNVIPLAKLFPEFIRLYFGLDLATVESLKDVSYSSLLGIKSVILFPRVINFSLEGDSYLDGSTYDSNKTYAWGYELLADIRTQVLRQDLIELLRAK